MNQKLGSQPEFDSPRSAIKLKKQRHDSALNVPKFTKESIDDGDFTAEEILMKATLLS